MKELLLKLAMLLRERAANQGREKVARCAKIAQAAVGLELLRKKIGGE
jgi:hypothetical protein